MPRWIWNPVPDLAKPPIPTYIWILGKVLEDGGVGRGGMIYSSDYLSLCPEIWGESSRNQTQLSQKNYQADILAVPWDMPGAAVRPAV